MSLYITSLNSGSNGNCYYVGNHREAVLIDAGISCREAEKRLERSGLSFKKIRAVFISHEHTDHICGAKVIARKYQIPVFLKNRIRGDEGHLSNHQALELFTTHKSPFMSHLLLSHLSEQNNSPQLVHDLFMKTNFRL